MNKHLMYLAMFAAGAMIGIAGYSLFISPAKEATAQSGEKKPLYWVAPMDPNYKRDKPGKSPMGMDLIPVYEEDGGGADAGPGTIRISPDVVNNLGVRTATAERKALHTEIKTVGYVQYDEDQLVHVHPRVQGWIEKLYVKAEGDPIEKGAPLYALYSPELVNAQEELVLALDRNNQRLIRAAEERLQALQIPATTIQALKKSRQVKQTITVFAPQTGVVDNLNIREGFFVNPGTTLMSIGVLDEVWVIAEVFERQVAQVSEGDAVTMSLDYLPGKTWRGTVDYVYPTLNDKTRTAQVRMRFTNTERQLKPDMFAQVVIHSSGDENALLIPREAVIRTGSQDRVVLALGEGRFKSIEVKVGRLDERQAEILHGLEEGERIVTSAQFLLDSESSKSSDFKRMHHGSGAEATAETVWVEATVNSLMPDHRMVNVTHQAIEEWNWPRMTMDFTVADTVDFAALKKGMTLHIEIGKVGENYRISKLHIPDDDAGGEDDKKQEMNRNGMDHSEHQSMDHSQHKGMDHDASGHRE